jgi:Trypsin
MTWWRWLATGVLGGCALGCGNATPRELSESQVERIVAGEPSGADQDGVVLLRAILEDQSEILCSASLVGPNLILTAAHCVTYLTEGDFSCSVRGELTDNRTGGGRLGLHVAAGSLEVYAGKTPRKSPLAHGLKVISTLPPDVCQDDLAFVVLDSALELPVVPMRLGRPALLHEAAVLVGYGTGANDEYINYKTQPRQQKRGLEVAAVGPDSLDDGVTDTPPRVLNIEGPSGCVGDSGGPLLAESSGAVLGVYSLQGGGGCSAQAVHSHLVHVPPYQGLIDEAFAAAGCDPVPELTPAAGGAGEAGGAPEGAAGSESVEPSSTGGVGGAAEGASAEPELTPQASKSSGCSIAAGQGLDTEASCLVALLALGTVGRRRNPGSLGRRRKRAACRLA